MYLCSQVLLLARQLLVAQVGVFLTEEVSGAIPPPGGQLPLQLLGLAAAAAATATTTSNSC
jgi:hypothetical protein